MMVPAFADASRPIWDIGVRRCDSKKKPNEKREKRRRVQFLQRGNCFQIIGIFRRVGREGPGVEKEGARDRKKKKRKEANG